MLNRVQIKAALTKAINIAPTAVELKRKPQIPDGMNGFTLGAEETVNSFDGLINMSSASKGDKTSTDAGATEKESNITMISVLDSPFLILKGDYFTADGITYRVKCAIPMYQIYWVTELEVDV